MKRCPRCPRLIPNTARYCAQCQAGYEATRGTAEERGYDSAHRRERRRLQAQMDRGVTYLCPRCNQPVDPSDWDLGHTDDRTTWTGPEHPRSCNRAAAGRKGAAITNSQG